MCISIRSFDELFRRIERPQPANEQGSVDKRVTEFIEISFHFMSDNHFAVVIVEFQGTFCFG